MGMTYITPTAKQVTKAKEIESKTGSPREVLVYILSGVVPERVTKGQEIVDLKARVEALEVKKIIQNNREQRRNSYD